MSVSVSQATAADKPPCEKHMCTKHHIAMEPDGSGGHFCLQCMQDTINEMEDEKESQLIHQHAGVMVPMDTGPTTDDKDKDKDDADKLADQMGRSLLFRDPGQASGGYVASSTMVGTSSGLTLPAGAKYSFDLTVINKAIVPSHDDSHSNLGVETLDTTTVTHPPVENDPPLVEPDNLMVYQPPMANYDTLTEPQFMFAPVQASEGSSVAHNLIKLLQQEGYQTSSGGSSTLPGGEGMLLLRGEAELSALISILPTFNIELAAHSLSDLKALLLSGKKVIIRMIQKNGTITVIHIHPADNAQALIITEIGMQSASIPIDSIITLLNTFLTNEEVTLLTLFTHTEVTNDLPTALFPQTQGVTATASVTAPASLATAIIDYIQRLQHSSPVIPPDINYGAVQELQDTHDQASLDILMTTYGLQSIPTEDTALQNIEEFSTTQTPFMAQLIVPNQPATVISLQPDSAGDVTLTVSGQHFVIDRRNVGELFDWIINQFKPVIKIFILMALFL
ncbi:hypothetical protein [Endozoicomonas numazuensis]|nr:hypothetical protein [Endozoicomonas numazuensis]